MSDIHAARTDPVQSDHGQTNVNTAYGPKVGVGVLLIELDFFEPLEKCAVREALEEVGVEIAIERLLCVTDHCLREEGQHWVAPAYLGRILRSEATNREPDKTQEVRWFHPNQLPANLTMTARNAVAAYHRRA